MYTTYKQPTKHEHRENLSVRAERASAEIFRIYMFQNSYFFQCLSWYYYLRILSVCLIVTSTLLHNVLSLCAVLLDMAL